MLALTVKRLRGARADSRVERLEDAVEELEALAGRDLLEGFTGLNATEHDNAILDDGPKHLIALPAACQLADDTLRHQFRQQTTELAMPMTSWNKTTM
eukprot:749424-Hanusia_phi.AAC.1